MRSLTARTSLRGWTLVEPLRTASSKYERIFTDRQRLTAPALARAPQETQSLSDSAWMVAFYLGTSAIWLLMVVPVSRRQFEYVSPKAAAIAAIAFAGVDR